MKRLGCWLAVASMACLASAWAQTNRGPSIGYVYPAGGRQGTVFRVVVGGQFLQGAHGAHISGDGVRASVIEYVRALDNNELRDVRTFLRELVRRRWSAKAVSAANAKPPDEPPLPDHPWLRDMDQKSVRELDRLRTSLFDPKKQPNAQIAEQVQIEVTIDPGAAPGDRELRLLTPDGLTSPVVFQVGTLPEVREEDFLAPENPRTPVVDLPTVLNGQIMPGETDRFAFRARKGRQLVIRLQARHLVPYLADAVPGWFQAVLALYDAAGNEVAYGDDYRFDPDPVLLFDVPEDGVYTLEVRDAIYRGRDDFVYRIAVGELPFVTRMFPLGGRVGERTEASIAGWNLPTGTLSLDTQAGGGAFRLVKAGPDASPCNDVMYAVDTLPETAEAEPNGSAAGAQTVTVPVVINGHIAQPGDVDIFRFEGRAGEEIVAEVLARRLDSPLDSVLRLADETGRILATNDDTEDPEMGLVTHPADSYLRVELPEDGAYSIHLSDTQLHGGDAYAYRLRLGPPRPDFALRVTPSSINVSAGRSATFTVHAVRKDGFDGDIDIALKGAPEGFTLGAVRIPTDKDSASARLTAPRGAKRQVFRLELEGRAEIDGTAVVRPGVPAEDMMQAFLWRHLVPQQELMVAVTGPRPVPAVWRPLVQGIELADAAPVQIPLGGTAEVAVKAPRVLADQRRSALEAVQFHLIAAARGVTLEGAIVAPEGLILTLKADANTALAGDSAHIIVEATIDLEGNATGGESMTRPQRVSLGVLPAIAYEIVRPSTTAEATP